MLMGRQPAPIKFPLVFAVALAFFVSLPVLQLAGALFSIRRFRRWQQIPQTRPRTPTRRTIRIALPALGNAALGVVLLVGLPLAFQSYLRIMRLFQPGLGWAITLSGWFALAWAVVRTMIAIRSSHPPRASNPG
jgi:hypothetical protein